MNVSGSLSLDEIGIRASGVPYRAECGGCLDKKIFLLPGARFKQKIQAKAPLPLFISIFTRFCDHRLSSPLLSFIVFSNSLWWHQRSHLFSYNDITLPWRNIILGTESGSTRYNSRGTAGPFPGFKTNSFAAICCWLVEDDNQVPFHWLTHISSESILSISEMVFLNTVELVTAFLTH